MIISASYKTDIPAFYGEWFTNRLRAGYCMMRNPMNRKPIRVSLSRPQMDGIVFWTKNFRPFLKYLDIVTELEIPFIVQYTINGYSSSLEHNIVDWKRSAETVCALAERFGSRCVIWRYDTIIFSQETPVEFHLENFTRIADALKGVVDEVVISFMQLYQKTKRNMDAMALEWNNSWDDPPVEIKRDLAAQLFDLAKQHDILLTICSQPDIVTVQPPSRCIDAARLSDVAGRPIISKIAGNRPGCECAASRDTRDYDTCPHGCVYCYAVRSKDLAIRRFREHDPESEYLFDAPSMLDEKNQFAQNEDQISLDL
jgi:hypothetical protein